VADVDLVVVEGPEEAARAAAERLVQAARDGSEIALAGGSTPRRAYELAAGLEPDWTRAGVWWGDDRCVPPDDSRSNYLLVRESLLDALARPPRVHRIRGELAPDAAAEDYDLELREATIDLCLLGLGADGHTASLFPRSLALEERERLAVAAEPGLEPFVPRVTMTLPALAAAGELVFLVTGDDKAEAAARAFGDEPDPRTPASLVRSARGRTVALLDRAAASQLTRPG
jgi:6-phosphogluconolactonase